MDSRREAMYRQVSVFRGTISGLILYVALALKVIGGSTTTSLDSSLHPNSVAFPNCTGTTSGIGDGSCDDENNNVVGTIASSRIGHECWDTETTDYLYILRSIVYGMSNIHLFTSIVHHDQIDPRSFWLCLAAGMWLRWGGLLRMQLRGHRILSLHKSRHYLSGPRGGGPPTGL